MTKSFATDKYEYKDLNEDKEAFLIRELSENHTQINAHIESFRRWTNSMPHFQCPTDSKFLLRFLRVAKFDHQKAQKRLDNFCTVRSSPRGSPIFFQQLQLTDSRLEAYLNTKCQIVLGKIDSGELIILYRWRALNSFHFTLEELLKFFFMVLDVVAADEESQIYGVRLLGDFDSVDREVLEKVANPKIVKCFYSCVQHSYPVRLKGQMLCGSSPLFDVFYRILHFFMSRKTKSRTIKIPQNIEKVVDMVPGLEKILPKEYNGQGGTLDECAERWNDKFRKHFANEKTFKSIHVDESKRPKETLTFLVDYPEYTEESSEKEGTFTKFDVL